MTARCVKHIYYLLYANGDSTCLVDVTLLVFVQRKDSEKGYRPRLTSGLPSTKVKDTPRMKE